MKSQVLAGAVVGVVFAMGVRSVHGAGAVALTRAQWLNRIGDSVQSETALRATLRQVHATNKVEFLQRSVKAVSRMPVSPDEKAAAFIRTVAVSIASERGLQKRLLIAEAFADVPVEYLPLLTEQLSAGFAPVLAKMTPEQYQRTVGEILKTVFARNAQTDEPPVRNTFAILAFTRKGDAAEAQDKLLGLLPDERTRSLAASWVPPALGKGNFEAMLAAADVEPVNVSKDGVDKAVGGAGQNVGAGLASEPSVPVLTREQWMSKLADAVKDEKLLKATLKQVPSADKTAFVQEAVKVISGLPVSNEEKANAYIRLAAFSIASETGAPKRNVIAEVFAIVPLEFLPVMTEKLGQRFTQEYNKLSDQQYKKIVDDILAVAFERNKSTEAKDVRDAFVILAFMRGRDLDIIPWELLPEGSRAAVNQLVSNASQTGNTDALVTNGGGQPINLNEGSVTDAPTEPMVTEPQGPGEGTGETGTGQTGTGETGTGEAGGGEAGGGEGGGGDMGGGGEGGVGDTGTGTGTSGGFGTNPVPPGYQNQET